ncbi:MAG TPA: NRAMP family divalent metal transporter [Flavitalea sp.]|nr:NRAMP family divalent metal transporter [Flavitalea sp.]
MEKKSYTNILIGAAFLMATSAIGPGFLTQTTVFTEKLFASFGFVILVSVLMDIAAQLNIWRIVAIAEMRAQDIANALFPGLGFVLALLILFGGLAFNIGNIAGAGMGLNVLLGVDITTGAIISCVLAISIFIVKEAGKAMDVAAKFLGILMIGLILYVAWESRPPVGQAIKETFLPVKTDLQAILILVGGTVGGYITFAGAHRLMDAGIKGKSNLDYVSRSAVGAIGLATIMRVLLFLAALGVVAGGGVLNKENPTASVFQIASGELGYKLFGIVLWSAAITSVVGSAYTSISFIKSFHPLLEKYSRQIIIVFILISTAIFVFVGKPVSILLLAGAVNGLILPVALAIMLIAAHKKKIVGDYIHPRWMTAIGVVVVLAMTYIGVWALFAEFEF